MEVDVKAEIKKKEAELATLIGVLKELNTQRLTVANDIVGCQRFIMYLKALDGDKGKG